MSKALCCFAPGLEECEWLVSVDLLRRAGVDVTIAAVSEKRRIVGAHGIQIDCDALLAEVDYSAYDALLLPGGMLLVCCYPGHAEGQRELDALREAFAAVPPQAFNILEHRFVNAGPGAPVCFAAEKQ